MNRNIIKTFTSVEGIEEVLASLLRLKQSKYNYSYNKYSINTGNSTDEFYQVSDFNKNRMVLLNNDIDDVYHEIIVVCEDEYLDRVKATIIFFQEQSMLVNNKSTIEPNIIVYNEENLKAEYRDILEINKDNVKPIK